MTRHVIGRLLASASLVCVLAGTLPAQVDGSRLDEIDAAATHGETAVAIQLLRQELERNPGWPEGWWRLATLSYGAGMYGAARRAFEKAAAADPKGGLGRAFLGFCDFQLQDYGAALNHLREAQSLALPQPEVRELAIYYEALIWNLRGNFEQAELLLKKLARTGHRSEELITALGMAALRIAVLPGNSKLERSQAEILRRVGEADYLAATQHPDQAMSAFYAIARTETQLKNVHYAYGSMACNAGEFDKAAAEFRRELEVAPDSVPARIGLAYIGLQTESVPDALQLASQAVELDPRSFAARLLLGESLLKAGKAEESVRELEICKELNAESSTVRYTLMRALFAVHRKAEALQEKLAFERLKPQEEVVLFGERPH